MKLSLLSALLPLVAVAACATSSKGGGVDPATSGDGTTSPDGTPAGDDSDDPSLQPPHALGTIVLGEAHGSGLSTKSTPIVTATFIPDAVLGKTCKKALTEGCEIQQLPKCTTSTTSANGCGANEACTFDTSCASVCKPNAVCPKACDVDEVCALSSALTTGITGTAGTTSATGTCVKVETFDAGPLAFSGTTTTITMYPPYKFESDGQGAPFLAGAELRVQATGAVETGFEKFDETFTATTFLQTTPSLAKIPRETIFGTADVPLAWVPANDAIVVSVTGAGGTATCKVKDSLGKFDIPRAVVEAAKGDAATGAGAYLSLSVARQKKDVKKDKHAKGELQTSKIMPDGWLELVTLSSESASYQGCASSTQTLCDDVCVDASRDVDNCGKCGNACMGSQTCVRGTCTAPAPPPSPPPAPAPSCVSCKATATAGACSSYNATCQADVYCPSLAACAAQCSTASCVTSCETSYPNGVTKYASLKSCLQGSCSASCP